MNFDGKINSCIPSKTARVEEQRPNINVDLWIKLREMKYHPCVSAWGTCLVRNPFNKKSPLFHIRTNVQRKGTASFMVLSIAYEQLETRHKCTRCTSRVVTLLLPAPPIWVLQSWIHISVWLKCRVKKHPAEQMKRSQGFMCGLLKTAKWNMTLKGNPTFCEHYDDNI